MKKSFEEDVIDRLARIEIYVSTHKWRILRLEAGFIAIGVIILWVFIKSRVPHVLQ